AVEIGILAREEIVLGDAHQHVEVAGRSALKTARALAVDPHLHPVLDPGGDLDLEEMLAPDAAFTPARRARFAIELALTPALGTGAGHREEPLGDPDLAAAVADVARHGAAAGFGAGARPRAADFQCRNPSLGPAAPPAVF